LPKKTSIPIVLVNNMPAGKAFNKINELFGQSTSLDSWLAIFMIDEKIEN
jgi:hypothetical protein